MYVMMNSSLLSKSHCCSCYFWLGLLSDDDFLILHPGPLLVIILVIHREVPVLGPIKHGLHVRLSQFSPSLQLFIIFIILLTRVNSYVCILVIEFMYVQMSC